MTRLIYLVQGELLSGGVIEAQVIATLRAHGRIGGQPPTRLIFLEPLRTAGSAAARGALHALRRAWPEGRIQLLPFSSRWPRGSRALVLALALARARLSGKLVFHCRGPRATITAASLRRLLGRARIVFDLRGPIAHETLHRLGHRGLQDLPGAARRAFELSRAAERDAVAAADFVLAVSPGLAGYAVTTLGAKPELTAVVPSCVEALTYSAERRAAARAAWDVRGAAPVLVYAGMLAPERLPGHMLRIFALVRRRRPEARLVLYCYRNTLEDLGRLLERAGVPSERVLLLRRDHEQVMAELAGADVGLLFCEPALRYHDWFPIKFPEYLAAGLPVALNREVGRLPELVERRRIGWRLDPDADPADLERAIDDLVGQLERDREGLRRRALACCAEQFLWSGHLPTVRRAYGLGGA